MRTGGQDVSDSPRVLTDEETKLRTRLIFEETLETLFDGLGLGSLVLSSTDPSGSIALSFCITKEDFRAVRLFPIPRYNTDLVELADGLADLAFVCDGTACAAGIDLEPVHAEVARSNMSKFVKDEEGNLVVIRDSNGKIQKPPTYSPPDIASIIEAQKGKAIS